jgi:hypothetical protein
MSVADGRCCEGFRMPAADGRCRAHGRPASENLQGRKPREARRGRFVTHYGDLSAANAARD